MLVEQIFKTYENVNLLAVTTAEEGLDLVSKQSLDLILMDIDLPGMDGYEALSVLRSNEETRSIPVVALSANAMRHQVERKSEFIFDEYITKPFDVYDFLSTISRFID